MTLRLCLEMHAISLAHAGTLIIYFAPAFYRTLKITNYIFILEALISSCSLERIICKQLSPFIHPSMTLILFVANTGCANVITEKNL